MKKKELYAAPAAEVLELSLGGVILAMSGEQLPDLFDQDFSDIWG